LAVVGFGVIFAGVVSSVLAGATTALLLAFILPVSLAAPVSAVPDRLAGWAMAAGVALVATALLWPAPARDRLRGAASAACRALAARLRAGVAYLLSGMDEQFALDRDHAAAQADQAVEALRSAFLATPYRPTGLSTPARTTVRLVDELNWLNSIVIQPGLHRDGVNRAALRVKEAAAAVLDRAADLLDARGASSDELDAALTGLAAAHAKMQEGYLASTVRFGMSRGDPSTPALPAPAGDAARAAAASRRLHDAFRTYLAERGAKRLPLADVAGLVTGVAGLRLEADAVLDLWQGDDGQAGGDVAAARHEILGTSTGTASAWPTIANSTPSSAVPVPGPTPGRHSPSASATKKPSCDGSLTCRPSSGSGTAIPSPAPMSTGQADPPLSPRRS
jgi:hypothetical protein